VIPVIAGHRSAASVKRLMNNPSVGAAARIRPATFADYPQIAALSARYGLNSKNTEEWMHLWRDNPVYVGLPSWTIGWVLETASEEIVGHIANIPSHLEFKGRRLLAASGGGLVVDEHYRSYSFALFSQYCNQFAPDLFLNTSVNANGMPLHQLFHFLPVPSGAWNRASFWVTNYPNFASRMLMQKQWPLWLTYPTAAAVAIKDSLRPHVSAKIKSGLELNLRDRFDADFDEFWRSLSDRSSSVLGVRSRETLDWHFKYALQNGTAWIATITRGKQLLAYAAFLRQDNHEVGLNRMRLVDFQALDRDPEHLVPMIALALKKCRAQEIHMLEAIGFAPDKQRVLSRIAPHQRELPCWLYFYKSNKKDLQLAEQLRDPAAWDPSSFDGDGSL
jgi:hypothetical protein